MTAGGKLEVPVKQKVVWAVISGAIAMIMLLGSASLLKGLLTEVDKPKAATKRVN
jgi:BCCT family betaine/carnitine transporter